MHDLIAIAPLLGLLLTFLQTIVAIISLAHGWSQRSEQTAERVAQRRRSLSLLRKGFIMFIYGTVVTAIIFAVIYANTAKPLRIESLAKLVQLTLGLPVAFLWTALARLFWITGRSVSIAVVYGVILSALATILSFEQQKPTSNEVILSLMAYLQIHFMLNGIAVFLIFLTLTKWAAIDMMEELF